MPKSMHPSIPGIDRNPLRIDPLLVSRQGAPILHLPGRGIVRPAGIGPSSTSRWWRNCHPI